MINTTDKSIILIAPDELDVSIRDAMDWAIEEINQHFENLGKSSTRRPSPKPNSFDLFANKDNRKANLFDESFIQSTYDFATSDAQNMAAKEPMKNLASYMLKSTVGAQGFSITKRGFKLVLVRLWQKGVLLLPAKFTPSSGFAYSLFDNEILKWLLTFDPDSEGEKHKTDTRRLYYFGPRLLMTTTWSTFEDVDINDISVLHRAWIKYQRGEHEHSLSCAQFPWTQLPANALNFAPTRVKFDAEDLIRYSAWILSKSPDSFDKFKQNVTPKREPSQPRIQSRLRTISHTVFPKPDLALEVRNSNTHEAVLEMFKKLGKRTDQMSWQKGYPTYPGREHINVEALCINWLIPIKSWLDHRENIQGYRSSHEVIPALNNLIDYLFLYLPWWKEIYKNTSLNLPTSPREFLRFNFVSRSNKGIDIESMPMTLLGAINIRRGTNATRTRSIRTLSLFFSFLESFYSEDELIAGSNFRNPIDLNFDLKRGSGSKSKTDKVIIPRNIYGYMLFYLYAVEQFGQYLQEKALKGELAEQRQKVRGQHFYNAESFGYVPILKYRGKEIPVPEIPNVFTWARRTVLIDGVQHTYWMPHLSALRTCIVALEMGLRFQSIQWLDEKSWDCENIEVAQSYIYKLFVNTDKTKTEPWIALMVYRVRDTLLREQSFQRMFVEYESAPAVFYEGKDNNPFGLINPLFKSARLNDPILDQTYFDAWTALQVSFELFYRNVTGEHHTQLFYLKRVKSIDSEVVIKYVGRDADPYCPISIRVIHTPHACRATFATNRQGEGTLDLSDCADLLGHEGEITTAHYTKPSHDQLQERMEKSDIALLSDYSIFDFGSESGYLRADTPNSALVTDFSKNRQRAITNYKFMAPMSLWTIDHSGLNDLDGLALLKEGPMSHIRFRETHICPVGEECPGDIIQGIGAAKRCGICPLSMKCVDHLPAISAKINLLLERVMFLRDMHKNLQASGEPVSVLDSIWEELQLDINELLGWKFCLETLNNQLSQIHLENKNEMTFHTGQPDIVRRHLKLVTRQSSKTEFLLKRLAESSAFPSMTSPQVQIAATALRRKISAGLDLTELAEPLRFNDDVRAVTTMLRTIMKTEGMTMEDISKLLDISANEIKMDVKKLKS